MVGGEQGARCNNAFGTNAAPTKGLRAVGVRRLMLMFGTFKSRQRARKRGIKSKKVSIKTYRVIGLLRVRSSPIISATAMMPASQRVRGPKIFRDVRGRFERVFMWTFPRVRTVGIQTVPAIWKDCIQANRSLSSIPQEGG